jgi:hypothetical protein
MKQIKIGVYAEDGEVVMIVGCESPSVSVVSRMTIVEQVDALIAKLIKKRNEAFPLEYEEEK